MKQVVKGFGVVLFVALVFLFSLKEEKAGQYEIVLLGDSIPGNVWEGKGMTDVLAERLGKSVFNGALGGTSMSVSNPRLRGSRVSSQWSMIRLAQAITWNDWGSQKAALGYATRYEEISTQILDYFQYRLQGLSEIDFEQVEILLIEHGTNDYNNGQRLENPEDKYDINTFAGALRSTLLLLQENWPNLRIVLITPIYCELGQNGINKCYNTDYGGGYLDAYVEMEKKVAAEFGVEVIDAYHDSGIWEENVDLYLGDKLHPSQEGHILLGNFIADYFLENED